MRDTRACRYCGYDIAELSDEALCPECGRPIRYSRQRSNLSRTAEYSSAALMIGIVAVLLSPLVGMILGMISLAFAILAMRRVPSGARTRIRKQALAASALGVLACVIQGWIVLSTFL
ncbi:MAG: hypothetical protein R3B57_15085 [Phycisphaerales bacterium]